MTLIRLLDVSRLPTLVDGGFGRAVQAEDGEVSSSRHGGEPVGLFARGRFRPKIEVRAAVGILRRLVARTERGEWLAIGETRGVLRLVESHRPEVSGGNVRGQVHLV